MDESRVSQGLKNLSNAAPGCGIEQLDARHNPLHQITRVTLVDM